LLECRIKTQDAIFGELATERLVEIGPAETLTNMASRTVDADYRIQDVAQGVQRELLSYNRDAAAIYHDASDQEPVAPVSSSSAPVLPTAVNPPATAPAPTTPPAAVPATDAAVVAPAPAAVSVPDRALTPQDIITALVALGLAKGSSDIAQDPTLKALCGGK